MALITPEDASALPHQTRQTRSRSRKSTTETASQQHDTRQNASVNETKRPAVKRGQSTVTVDSASSKDIQVQVDNNQNELHNHIRTAVTIHELSWEILASIFTLQVRNLRDYRHPTQRSFMDEKKLTQIHHSSNPTLILASVSRRWRDIALNTSQLWTHIHLDGRGLPHKLNHKHLPEYGHYLVSIVGVWLERSGRQLLDIGILEDRLMADLRSVLDPILVPQMGRCYKFQHYECYRPSIYTAIPTPALRIACLQSDCVLRGIFPRAPQLESLSVHMRGDLDEMEFRLFPLPYPRLTYLNLEGWYDLNLDDVLSALVGCSESLEMLRVDNIYINHNNPTLVSLPRLHTVQLRDPGLLLHFTHIDRLKTLYWEFRYFDTTRFQAINQATPSLENLEIFGCALDPEPEVDETELVAGLTALADLRSLCIHNLNISEDTLEAFAKSSPLICPQLTKLVIGDSEEMEFDEFLTMVHQRRYNGILHGEPARMTDAQFIPPYRHDRSSVLDAASQWQLNQLLMTNPLNFDE